MSVRVEGHQTLAAGLVGHRRDRRARLAQQIVDRVLDADVGHHLAADLAEPRQPVGQEDEAVVIDHPDVARRVPPVLHDRRSQRRLVQIAGHQVRPLDEQHAGPPVERAVARVLIDDFHGHAGNRMADRARLHPGLRFGAVAEVRPVGGDDRGHLRAAVAFVQREAEPFPEGGGERRPQFLGADDGVLEVRELLGGAPAEVRLAERRRADEHVAAIRGGELADGLGVHRVRMVDDRTALQQREP
jgi:hypothetical protein